MNDYPAITRTGAGVESPELAERVRHLFLDDAGAYGCAETAMVALQERFGLPDPGDSSAAMVLNGGIAYSGGMCGAITGAALAVGRLAGRRIEDHREAKTTARRLIMAVADEFLAEFGATDCRTLTGYDMTVAHEAFMEDGTWMTDCTRRLQFVVARLHSLADQAEWERALAALDS
jgi:C_GCAxxG_C_C family probable redox protein